LSFGTGIDLDVPFAAHLSGRRADGAKAPPQTARGRRAASDNAAKRSEATLEWTSCMTSSATAGDFRVFTVVDDHTHKSVALRVGTLLPSSCVAGALQ